MKSPLGEITKSMAREVCGKIKCSNFVPANLRLLLDM